MKKLIFGMSCLFAVSAWAGAPLSVDAAIQAQKQAGASCPAPERGKITKVDVVNEQGVKKLTRGGMKAVPGNYLVTYMAKGGQTDFQISASTIDAKATAADFKALVGTAGCLPAED